MEGARSSERTARRAGQGRGRGARGPREPRKSANGRDANRVCPDYHAAIEMIGRRWTGAILWVLTERPHYFAELSLGIPGLSDRLLSRRLRELEAEGLVERCVHDGTPARVSYALTEKGRALEPAIRELRRWAKRWNSSEGSGNG